MYDYNKSNMSKFEISFQKYLDENNNFNELEANEKHFESFIEDINKMLHECFLMEEGVLNSKHNQIKNPWITSGIIASISHKDYLYKLCRKSVKI